MVNLLPENGSKVIQYLMICLGQNIDVIVIHVSSLSTDDVRNT